MDSTNLEELERLLGAAYPLISPGPRYKSLSISTKLRVCFTDPVVGVLMAL
jgi:hypothetical protein